jgi:hypothetical protein
MAKLYTKSNSTAKKLLPKKETIAFLLNYSKALRIQKIGNTNFELICN